MASGLLEVLRKSDLEQLYPNLSGGGVAHLNDLAKLTVNEFSSLGITSTSDRKNLFELVKSIRNGTIKLTQPTSSSSTSRTSRSSSVSRAKVNVTKPGFFSKQRSTPEPNQSKFIETKPKVKTQVKKNSFSGVVLDAYCVPIKNGTQNAPVKCRLNSDLADKIRVCVRKRPLTVREIKRNESDIVDILTRRSLTFNETKLKVDMTKYMVRHGFIFDETFENNANNSEVYERTAKPLVNHVFQGGKATCFAYGQTGSGKTYTMLDETSGLYVLTAKDMFTQLALPKYEHLFLTVSFFEIYQGQLHDLLNSRARLEARENAKKQVIIGNLREIKVSSIHNLIKWYESGSDIRSTGTTMANADSSRSHAIMQLSLRSKAKPGELFGKFSFIDLAGSERGADRGKTNDKTRMEGAEINKSLLALKECIRALDKDQKHLPFRQSKLTQVLKESFIGEARTCMIATISPNSSNHEHTLNTLRYADRVKELRGETVDDELTDQDDLMITDEPEDDLEKSFVEPTNFNEPEDLVDSASPDLDLDNYKPEYSNHQPTQARAVIDIPDRLHFKECNPSNNSQPQRSTNSKYDMETIETVARNTRSQLRTITECCKIQTKLLTDLTHLMSKVQLTPEEQEIGFENYIFDLDEVLERKLVVIEDIKEQLAQIMYNANNRNK